MVIFYQGFIDFLNRIVHIENIRLKPIAKVSVFTYDYIGLMTLPFVGTRKVAETQSSTSAEGATYISHGCKPMV